MENLYICLYLFFKDLPEMELSICKAVSLSALTVEEIDMHKVKETKIICHMKDVPKLLDIPDNVFSNCIVLLLSLILGHTIFIKSKS
jgi:hypothetical protein